MLYLLRHFTWGERRRGVSLFAGVYYGTQHEVTQHAPVTAGTHRQINVCPVGQLRRNVVPDGFKRLKCFPRPAGKYSSVRYRGGTVMEAQPAG